MKKRTRLKNGEQMLKTAAGLLEFNVTKKFFGSLIITRRGQGYFNCRIIFKEGRDFNLLPFGYVIHGRLWVEPFGGPARWIKKRKEHNLYVKGEFGRTMDDPCVLAVFDGKSFNFYWNGNYRRCKNE